VRAFVVEHHGDEVTAGVRDVDADAFLDEGDVRVDVAWSCLNFKDAMVAQPKSRVARRDVLIGGVDAVGVVAASQGTPWRVGDAVIAHGHGFGTSHHGGFAPKLRCDPAWLTPLPRGLGARDAMVLGTAGYTAMASILALEATGLANDAGPVLVTGATGGVGSVAVALLSARGFEVTAMTGKPTEHGYLAALGATDVVARDALEDRPERVLGAARFAGAVDCVGGETLAGILRVLRWGGAVAATGLVGGPQIHTTVYPFITRNVALLGIDSVEAPARVREVVWDTLACALPATTVEALVAREVGLDGVGEGLAALERAAVRGRILVDPSR
jgi:putative YhdH/YhfP family quinone oxidoreductase